MASSELDYKNDDIQLNTAIELAMFLAERFNKFKSRVDKQWSDSSKKGSDIHFKHETIKR